MRKNQRSSRTRRTKNPDEILFSVATPKHRQEIAYRFVGSNRHFKGRYDAFRKTVISTGNGIEFVEESGLRAWLPLEGVAS